LVDRTTKLMINSALGDESLECQLSKKDMKIGRSPQNNDIVLIDVQISREHALLSSRGEDFYITDLQSANGTFLNGDRVLGERRFTEDDVLQIGKYFLRLRHEFDLASLVSQAPTNNPRGTIMMRSPTTASILLSKDDISKEKDTPDELRKELVQLRKKAEVLSYLYELSGMFSTVFSLDEIFDRTADMLFRVTPAQRCLVQIKDSQTGILQTRMLKFRDAEHQGNERVSPPRAIVEQVMRDRITLLSLDAQMDERIMGKSVMLQNVQSVICAPLTVGNDILGVIYIDTHRGHHVFGPEDIDLLNAIAVQTSMALDNATAHERLMREALAREAYGRFLPDHIVNQILASPDSLKLGGTNIEATVLFADVRGFTSLSEKLRPEQVVDMLNEYFTVMTEIIFSHQGLLDKYIGDGLMALFGVAYGAEEAPLNAAKAAIDMQHQMITLRQNFEQRYGHSLNIGIGINTGIITVGYIGSQRRMEYTGIGDAVNLAARLESNTKPGQIIVSATTNRSIEKVITTNCLGKIPIKGKSEPQEIFEVLWNTDPSPEIVTPKIGYYFDPKELGEARTGSLSEEGLNAKNAPEVNNS
jgi:adenylate cyclase